MTAAIIWLIVWAFLATTGTTTGTILGGLIGSLSEKDGVIQAGVVLGTLAGAAWSLFCFVQAILQIVTIVQLALA